MTVLIPTSMVMNNREQEVTKQDKDIQENGTSWYLHHKLAPNAWVGRNVRSVEIVFE